MKVVQSPSKIAMPIDFTTCFRRLRTCFIKYQINCLKCNFTDCVILLSVVSHGRAEYSLRLGLFGIDDIVTVYCSSHVTTTANHRKTQAILYISD